MIIGIDISQTAYPKTGVAAYIRRLVREMIHIDRKNKYILFYSSFRVNPDLSFLNGVDHVNVEVRILRLPQKLLSFVWNKMHAFPIEKLIGPVDVFLTSDWVEPPVLKAKKATIIYDLVVYKYPTETDQRIVANQREKLGWVKNESEAVFCISSATKKDAKDLLKIDSRKLFTIYPGI